MIQPYTRKVRYYETDQMGVVHHSNYIRYFEEARTDFWDQLGLDYHAMERDGLLVPVLSVSCRYKKPLRYPQAFVIKLRFSKFNGVRFHVEYEVCSAESGSLLATGESEHCFADARLKPVRLAKQHPEMMQRVLAVFSNEE